MLRCNGADVALHRAGPPPSGFDRGTFTRHLADVCASEVRAWAGGAGRAGVRGLEPLTGGRQGVQGCGWA